MESHPLLTTDLTIDSNLIEFLKNGNWSNSKDYVTLSIIGAQGTGKSTILNAIFGTSFKAKNKSHNGRTTIGADIGILEESKDKYFILIDSEGIGCEARQEECKNQKIEHSIFDARLTSFILSTVDVLLININACQIGQATASWSTLVQKIIAINMEFIPLNDNRRKTILYVIRDFEDRLHDQETIKERILNSYHNEEELDQGTEYKSTEEIKFLDKVKERYDIKFEFIPHFIYCEASFKETWKKLKQIILDDFGVFQIERAIGDLEYDYQNNLTTILKNYKWSAQKMIQKCLEIEKFYNEEWENIENKIMNYSSLKQLYEERVQIIEESSRIYRERVDVDFQDLDIFNKGIDKIKNKASSWFKTIAKTLFDEEIEKLCLFSYKELKLIPQLEINENDPCHSKINKILNYKRNQIAEFNLFITSMEDNWFDLNIYNNNTQQILKNMMDEMWRNYETIIEIVNEMENNSRDCVKKYIIDVFEDNKIIFNLIDIDYFDDFRDFMIDYTKGLKSYVKFGSFGLSKVGVQPNLQSIDNDFINEIFSQPRKKIYEYWDHISESFKEDYRKTIWDKWITLAITKYQTWIDEILKHWEGYEDDEKINEGFEHCTNLILDCINNFVLIKIPMFKSNTDEVLILDKESIKNIKEKFKHEVSYINKKTISKIHNYHHWKTLK